MASTSNAFVQVGKKAPDFEVKDQENRLISLNSLLKNGPVVLYFYPKAMTSGCTVQACGVRDHLTDFARLGVTVVGMSPDKPESLKKFSQRDNLGFLLLSDVDHKVAELYGTWVEKSMYGRKYFGFSRTTFIVSASGIVAHVIPKADPKTHHADVLEWIQNLPSFSVKGRS